MFLLLEEFTFFASWHFLTPLFIWYKRNWNEKVDLYDEVDISYSHFSTEVNKEPSLKFWTAGRSVSGPQHTFFFFLFFLNRAACASLNSMAFMGNHQNMFLWLTIIRLSFNFFVSVITCWILRCFCPTVRLRCFIWPQQRNQISYNIYSFPQVIIHTSVLSMFHVCLSFRFLRERQRKPHAANE